MDANYVWHTLYRGTRLLRTTRNADIEVIRTKLAEPAWPTHYTQPRLIRTSIYIPDKNALTNVSVLSGGLCIVKNAWSEDLDNHWQLTFVMYVERIDRYRQSVTKRDNPFFSTLLFLSCLWRRKFDRSLKQTLSEAEISAGGFLNPLRRFSASTPLNEERRI